MSLIDKVVSAVTPEESEQQRQQARAKARAAAESGDWLSLVLQHHVEIEGAFAAVKAASTPSERVAAQKELGVLLTGHANAEESVIYPALTRAGDKGHASTAYSEQATAKTEMAELETLAPMSQQYLDKLEQIRSAVAHHMYEEESNWFLDLKHKVPAAEQTKLTHRYEEEFERYVGEDGPWNADTPLAGAARERSGSLPSRSGHF
jgi:Hemerythrin HHE cation binding domain